MRSKRIYGARKRRREKVLRKCAAMRAAKARKREDGPMPERPPERLPAGEFIGTLEWQDASGEVKRWIVRQGRRVNQVRVNGMKEDHGWDYVLGKLRKKLSRKRLVLENAEMLKC